MRDSLRSILQHLVDQQDAEIHQRQAVQRVLAAMGHVAPPQTDIVQGPEDRERRFTWDTGELLGEVVLQGGRVSDADLAVAPAPNPAKRVYGDDQMPILLMERLNEYNKDAFYRAVEMGEKAFSWADYYYGSASEDEAA